jgi:hypothetical protein
VVVYLLPLLLIDIASNTMLTGAESDYFYYKTMFDGLLIAYAIYSLFTDKGTASRSVAQVGSAAGLVVAFLVILKIQWVAI